MKKANPYNTDPKRYTVKAIELAKILRKYPSYNVLLHATSCLPPSPWTECYTIRVDRQAKEIWLSGEFT